MAPEFRLEAQEYIPLNALLKTLNWVSTGGEANIRIIEGEIKVNGVTAFQKRKKIRAGDLVEYHQKRIKIL